MSPPVVQVDREPPIVLLTLNNPERRNVLGRAALEQLQAALAEIENDPELRCAILRAEGPAFSAGHDLDEIAQADREQLQSLFALCTEVMEGLRLLRVPVIAEVQAVATAAGCQLAASCDLIVASTAATFATPGVKIGLFCATPAVALGRCVAPKHALEMLLTGEPITAQRALEIGLVNRVVPPERLSAETLALARQIASASGATVAFGKRTFYRQWPLDWPAAYQIAEPAMVENALTPAAHEGIAAFLEKRPPKWED